MTWNWAYGSLYALNLDAQIEIATFTALLPTLQSGKCDIILSTLNKTPERSELIAFSEPYLRTETGLLVRADWYESGKSVVSIAMTGQQVDKALSDARVGAMVRTVGAAYITEHYPGAGLMLFDTTNDAVAALQGGKMDFAICGMSRALGFTRTNADVVYVDYPLTNEGLAVAVAKGREELRAGTAADFGGIFAFVNRSNS